MKNLIVFKGCLLILSFLNYNHACEVEEKYRSTEKSEDWGIANEVIRNAGYSFKEVELNISVGTILAQYPVINVGTVQLKGDNKYVDARLSNDFKHLQFILLRNLSDYRNEEWTASMEMEYTITRKTNQTSPTKTYTFMLIIKDGNIESPIFELEGVGNKVELESPFYIPILPWPETVPINNKRNIHVVDNDINLKYANITVSCEEFENFTSCDNFNITVTKLSSQESVRGHKYAVLLYFSSNSTINSLDGVEEGQEFSLNLLASDSLHTTRQTIRFVPLKVISKVGSESSNSSEFPIAAVVGAGSGVILLVAFGFSYTTWRNKKTKNILKKLTEAEIREFFDGTFSASMPKRSVDCNTPILAKPYNQAFEIPRDRLRIDETTVLGSGFFGVVMKGTVILENGESITVAVKAVKRNVGILYFKALLSELKIMSFIGKHSNIVSLIGACTHNIRKREVFITVELCENGNLHQYLRTHRTNFTNLVKDGKLCGFRENYSYKRKESSGVDKAISTMELLKWATQISNGLDFLTSLKVIHGDLATRNVLLSSNLTAKIADFGLSRRLVDVSSYYYTKQSQEPIPWKWMAIENLRDMKFSKHSDIWSFGIVLWEIFTMGQTPYPGLNWDENFVEKLEKGLRLPQPQFSSNDLYDIMKDCWTENPHDRPCIFDIKRSLETMTNSLLNQKTTDEGYFRVFGTEKTVYISDNFTGPDLHEIHDLANTNADC